MKNFFTITFVSLFLNFSLQASPGQKYLQNLLNHIQDNKTAYTLGFVAVTTAGLYYLSLEELSDNTSDCPTQNYCPTLLDPNWDTDLQGQTYITQAHLVPSPDIDYFFWVRGCVNNICSMGPKLDNLLANLKYYSLPLSKESELQLVNDASNWPSCLYKYVRWDNNSSNYRTIGWVELTTDQNFFETNE